MENTQNKNITTILKVLLLGGISLVLLIIDWVLISKALYTDKQLVFWVWPAISIILTIALTTIFAIVNNSRMYMLAYGILGFVAYLLIFPKDVFVIAGGGLFFLLLYWFNVRVKDEEDARQDFSIRRVSNACINAIILAFMLLLSLNIYYNTSAEFKSNPEGFYDTLGRSVAKSTRYLGQGSGDKVDLNQTLDQYLETETRKQVPNYETIPQDFREQYLENTKEQFYRVFNLDVPSDQPISEIIAQFAVERVRTAAEKKNIWFPLIFTLIILALLRTFSFVLRWLAILFTWLIYKFLLRIKFLRLEKVNVEAQKLIV
jgi:hypothetical protein